MKKLLLIGSPVLIMVLTLTSCLGGQSQAPSSNIPYQMPGGQGGMGGSGMMGPGMMGPGGMVGGGGMMGGWGGYNPDAEQITIDDAIKSAERYLGAYYGHDLALVEVMEFAWNFYAEVEEEDTGVHAIELIIDKYTGQVSPEMGPNMMWNTKYGMMGNGSGLPAAGMPVTPEQAQQLAQQFLDNRLPGVAADEAETFYGYYTLHTLKDGEIEGMLSVNGYTGAVWYHNWHGAYIQMEELEH